MKGRKVIVGVTGGIAAYKAAELVRLLVKEGAVTKVAMTRHATKFITPLTLEALSGSRVVSDMWDPETHPLDHITWGQESDLIIIAPATANFIGKMAHGIGDDFLSTLVIAATARLLVCPSMNTQMYLSQAVQENLQILKARGCAILEPGSGELACRTEGPGRLPEPEDIVEEARMLLSKQDLSGLRILVTAGATLEPLDPVRYMSNRSTGKMGYALARAARRRGAKVSLVSGPTALKPPRDVALSRVKTAEEMRRTVLAECQQVDVIIKAAAVLDWRPKETAEHKIKKGRGVQTLELVENPDILAELGCSRGNNRCLLVGFAAETQDLIANAQEKLKKKNLDLIVVNDVSREDAGFEADTNAVKLVYRDGRMEELPLMSKEEVADQLLDRIKILWEKSS
ncbi:MAG: bifunctional phosphopantothenoylcysteine decarboxylase/phosphopantothenate--cysteine ligase CoaBC [Desulfobacteraceae bacterium]|nr:MAG: bifunctional phosphopantothenoylcysteine decarboxylase/phosphopantothenate--cysteine ligase CoaBC [Desulfobacteraceae bacterium]